MCFLRLGSKNNSRKATRLNFCCPNPAVSKALGDRSPETPTPNHKGGEKIMIILLKRNFMNVI